MPKQLSDYCQSETFTHVLQFVQTHPRACTMRQKGEKLTLTFDHVKNVKEAGERLRPMSK